ncbi:protein kinase, partial [Streptomyces sp. NPDC059063]
MTTPLLPEDPLTLGRHRLLARLGAGGMGQVYLARSPGGRLLAVKTVHAHLADEPHFRERFRREATAARAVTGAHTAAVVDADPDAEQPWLATAYLPGVTLRQAVAETGPFTPATARSLASCLAEALTGMHAAGIVHRDLKPSNVLLTADGPRVIDFGIARATGDHARGPLTATGAMLGTPGYMAPEQVLGTEVGPATDVFALGAVLAFATTGQHPFGTGPVAVLLYRAAHEDPDLTAVPETEGLRELITACLHRTPARRPTATAALTATTHPNPPLWWRDQPLRSLIAESTHTTSPLTASPTPLQEPTLATPTPTPTQKPAPAAPTHHRRRTLTRRSALLAGGGGLAALAGWAISTSSGRPDDTADADGLALSTGRKAPGATRWTLTLAAAGGGLDGMLLTGTTVLVHGPRPDSALGGTVHAVHATDGTSRWQQKGGSDAAPRMWGVVDDLLIAPDVLAGAADLRTGKPWPVENAWPGTTRWYAVAGRRLVTLGAVGSTDFELRLRTLPAGGSAVTRKDVPDWHRPAVHGSALLLAAQPGSFDEGAMCVDADRGATRWTYKGLGSDARAVAAPATLPQRGGRGPRFALVTDEGELHLIGVRDGKQLARRGLGIAAGRGTTAVGRVADTGLVLGGGRLIAFDPDDGKEL